jgi:rRNA pseudouridine-1189 N-methylase Emg1 (Nep1/Mra1 family)
MAVIENLKATAPPEPKKGQKRSRPEILHLALIKALEDRIDTIDAALVVSS